MSTDARSVANFILDLSESIEQPITHLSLHKILFFCHAWSLVDLKRPLIRHNFQAWKFGPVVQHIFNDFKEFGSKPITKRAVNLDWETGEFVEAKYFFDQEIENFLKNIVLFYCRVRASDLVDMTHVVGGPWHEIWHHSDSVRPGMKIPDQLIADFYSRCRKPFSIQ
jgi:uncharacterized phage-associated protein